MTDVFRSWYTVDGGAMDMKKVICSVLAVLMMVSLAACTLDESLAEYNKEYEAKRATLIEALREELDAE